MPCLVDACSQGRAACPAPMTCSGSTPLVDESIHLFSLDRLQEVRATDARWDAPTTAYHLTRPLAPGVIEGPDDASDYLKQDNALTAALRWFLIPAAICGAIAFLAGFAARALGWI